MMGLVMPKIKPSVYEMPKTTKRATREEMADAIFDAYLCLKTSMHRIEDIFMRENAYRNRKYNK